jgi:hypothetical protein
MRIPGHYIAAVVRSPVAGDMMGMVHRVGAMKVSAPHARNGMDHLEVHRTTTPCRFRGCAA